MILVLTPDYVRPSGGITVMYDIVDSLVASGREAAVWHGSAGVGCHQLRPSTPAVFGLRRTLALGDILLVPESGGPKHRALTGSARVVMLNQGHHFTFAGADFGEALPGAYPGWDNAVAALVTSEAIRALVDLATPADFPIHRIPIMVDAQLFAPAPKERRIALMPQRRRQDMIALDHLLRRSARMPSGWVIDVIEDRPRTEVATALSRAAIFVSGAERDGFGLGGAEAFAAGCHVVGFAGDGGREYLTADVATVIRDADLVGLTEAVMATAAAHDQGSAELQDRTNRGRQRVLERYSRAALADALERAVGALEAPDSPARQPVPATVAHYSVHTPSAGLITQSRILARQTGRVWLDLARQARHRQARDRQAHR